MALVVPENYASVIHSFTLAGDPDPFAITYGVEVNDPPVVATVDLLAADLNGNFETTVLTEMSNLITLRQTEIRWQTDPLPAPPQIGIFAGNNPGGNAGATPLLPQNSALLVHKRTALAGRKGRGRFYLPGVAEGWANNIGEVLTATVTDFNNSLADMLAGIIASANFVGMALFHDDDSLTPLPDPTLIQSLTLDPVIATQRRRLRR